MAAGFLEVKSSCTCSWAFGCCFRHSARRRGGITESAAFVRWILAWQPGQSESMRFMTDLPGTRTVPNRRPVLFEVFSASLSTYLLRMGPQYVLLFYFAHSSFPDNA